MASSIEYTELKVIATDGLIADAAWNDNSGKPKSHRKFHIVVTRLEIVADIIAVVCAIWASYGLYIFAGWGKHLQASPGVLTSVAVGFAIVMALLLERSGAYHPGNSLLRVRETERVLRASIQSSFIGFALSYFSGHNWSRALVAIALCAVPLFVLFEKNVAYNFVRWLHSKGYGVQRVLIYGAGSTGQRIFSALMRSPKLGLIPVAVLDDDPIKQGTPIYESSYVRRRSLKVSKGPLTKKLLSDFAVDRVLIGIPSVSKDKFLRITADASASGAAVSFVPYHLGPSVAWIDYADVDGLLLATFGAPQELERYELLKRSFDLVAGALILLLTLPWIAVIALATKLDSPGPIFFIQERVGRYGKKFNMFKFRTMYVDAPKYDLSPTRGSDPRITRLGRLLRRSSLDELPQLFNVLRGEMSLVGPRPEMPFIVEKYSALHRQRLEVTPGITGLWQLSADRMYLIHENIEYDLYYIRNRSFFIDLAIIFHTIAFAARGV
jgi:exopolysaccharide biosynthesis polyprenyl glycosylphosphotransferase